MAFGIKSHAVSSSESEVQLRVDVLAIATFDKLIGQLSRACSVSMKPMRQAISSRQAILRPWRSSMTCTYWPAWVSE